MLKLLMISQTKKKSKIFLVRFEYIGFDGFLDLFEEHGQSIWDTFNNIGKVKEAPSIRRAST
jgi:hypothetical protein